jgi:hypothetical protein
MSATAAESERKLRQRRSSEPRSQEPEARMKRTAMATLLIAGHLIKFRRNELTGLS